MDNIILIIGIALVIYNLVVFGVYGYDKSCAVKNKWRVPEKVLIGMGFLMGGPGAYIGMQLFRHKTKHTKFQILIPLFTILQLVLIVGATVKFT